jgi:hypothetical protein
VAGWFSLDTRGDVRPAGEESMGYFGDDKDKDPLAPAGPPADFEAVVDAALIAGMRPGLRDALEAGLAAGCTLRGILARVRRLTGGPHARPGGLVYLSVRAYLRQWRRGGKHDDA